MRKKYHVFYSNKPYLQPYIGRKQYTNLMSNYFKYITFDRKTEPFSLNHQTRIVLNQHVCSEIFGNLGNVKN